MNTTITTALFFIFFIFSISGFAEEPQLTLVGWGMDDENTDEFFADAKKVGFDVLITWSTEPLFLEKAVELGEKHDIRIFSSLTPDHKLAKWWKVEYPH